MHAVVMLVQSWDCIDQCRGKWEAGMGRRDAVVWCVYCGKIPSKMQSELVNVTKIYSNSRGWAFAALRNDGTVRAWGDELCMLPWLITALHGHAQQ